jgi:hypothetical protein
MEDPASFVLTLRKAVPQDSEFAYRTKREAFRHYVELASTRF